MDINDISNLLDSGAQYKVVDRVMAMLEDTNLETDALVKLLEIIKSEVEYAKTEQL